MWILGRSLNDTPESKIFKKKELNPELVGSLKHRDSSGLKKKKIYLIRLCLALLFAPK